MTRPIRVGIVGAGPISDWHVRAIRGAGMDVVAVSSRPGSARVEEFARRHAIEGVFEGWREMLVRADTLDAVVIATHTDGTPEVLEAFLPCGFPILVEKPVAWSSERIATLIPQAHSKVIVGFNRRFYRSIEAARGEVRDGPPLLVQVALPEDIATPTGADPDRSYLRPFFENSCHGLDLVRYLLGDLRVEAAVLLKTESGHIGGVSATLSTRRGDVVSFLGNWGTPANFSISLHRPGRRFDVMPLETGSLYEGMDVLEPSEECPIRRYIPRRTGTIALEETDRDQKPGFIAQAAALRSLVEGDPAPPQAATLDDARAVVALCEEISGVRYAS